MDKRIRDQLRAIEGEGLRVVRVVAQGNSHHRAYVEEPAGQFVVLSGSSAGGAGSAAMMVRRRARALKRGITLR